MMRKYLKYGLGCMLGLVGMTGCHYAEMQEYNDIPRISFVGSDNRNNDSYEAAYLKTSLNFAENVKGDTIQCDTLEVIVRILGDLAVQPLELYLSSEAVEGAEQPDFVFFNPYVLKDSAYRAVLKVGVNRPAQRDKTYRGKLVFDFEQSGFAPGLDSLLRYDVTVSDEVTWKLLQLSETDWEDYIQPYFGKYSDTKARFMIMAMRSTNFSLLTYSWNVNRYKNMCISALEHYNTVNAGNPLKDENGELVTFDPA